MLIDLQIHSTYSDGYLNPTEVAEFLNKNGVKIAALTDHNTIAGFDEFKLACQKRNIKSIIGLELYVKLKRKKFNLLWYNFDRTSSDLHKLLHETQLRRKRNVRNFLSKINKLGLEFQVEKILDKYTHYVPINHIIDEIISSKKNLLKIKKELGDNNLREDEIIRHYFYNSKIGRLHESYISVERVFKLKKKIGGQLILCHPGKFNGLKINFLEKLIKLGLDGIEVVSPHHNLNIIMYAQFLACKHKMIMTGGSDFHKNEDSKFINNCYDYFKIDSSKLTGIEKIVNIR